MPLIENGKTSSNFMLFGSSIAKSEDYVYDESVEDSNNSQPHHFCKEERVSKKQ